MCDPFAASFKGVFESAGERNFAVVVDRFLERYAFILQHRALEPGDPGPLKPPSVHLNHQGGGYSFLSLVQNVRLRRFMRPDCRR